MVNITERSWGYFKVLDSNKDHKVKTLVLRPGKAISIQRHFKRSEHWFIVSGTAEIINEPRIEDIDRCITLYSWDSIDIPVTNWHRVINKSDIHDLIIIETQTGFYFGEDDIVRYEM